MPRHHWACRPRKLTRSEQRVGPFLRNRLTGTKFKRRYYHGLGVEKCPHHEDLNSALSLSMDIGSQISYKQLPRECGIRRRWPLGGIHVGAQGTLIPVCLLNLSSRVTFYEKPPWTGPRTPCPCSQNTVSHGTDCTAPRLHGHAEQPACPATYSLQ